MLRRIHEDLQSKSYTRKAREVVRERPGLLSRVKSAVRSYSRPAADSIRSVVESHGVVIIKMETRGAMAEIYPAKDAILSVLREYGVERVRFQV